MKVFSVAPTDSRDLLAAGCVSGEASQCWTGSRITPKPFRWALAVDGTHLFFNTSLGCGAPQYNLAHKQGEFVEGLWNEDVVELFLMNGEGEYQEFNISPSGAWWSCTFSSYRQRTDVPVALTPVVLQTNVTAGGWSALFGVSLKDLVIPVLASQIRIHVSAIVTIDGERRYLSSSPVAGIEPDFHHSGCFVQMTLVHESR